ILARYLAQHDPALGDAWLSAEACVATQALLHAGHRLSQCSLGEQDVAQMRPRPCDPPLVAELLHTGKATPALIRSLAEVTARQRHHPPLDVTPGPPPRIATLLEEALTLPEQRVGLAQPAAHRYDAALVPDGIAQGKPIACLHRDSLALGIEL